MSSSSSPASSIIRTTPRAFSSVLSHFVVAGQSGITNAVIKAKKTVAAPSMIKSHLPHISNNVQEDGYCSMLVVHIPPAGNGVVLESRLNSSCEQTSKGTRKHSSAEEDSESKTEFLTSVPTGEEESDTSEEGGLFHSQSLSLAAMPPHTYFCDS